MAITPRDPPERRTADVLDDPVAHGPLFDAFPSLVWCADGDGGCSFVNQAWMDYTGRSLAQERGAGWLLSVHPEDREPLGRQWTEALGLRRRLDTEYRLRRASGDYGWVQHSAEPVTDEAGRLAGYLGTCHDITERRDAELQARARAREVRLLADNVPVLMDAVGGVNAGRIEIALHLGDGFGAVVADFVGNGGAAGERGNAANDGGLCPDHVCLPLSA